MNNDKIKVGIIIVGLIVFLILVISQINVDPVQAYSKNIRTKLIDENLDNSLLPTFKHDRYNIELNIKTDIEIILEPDSKVVYVEVISGEGAGIGIDNDTVRVKGLKIYNSARRNKQSKEEVLKEKKRAGYRAKFNLQDSSIKSKIIKGIDHNILKITVEGILPGYYTVKAVVNEGGTAITKIFTEPDFRIDGVIPSVIALDAESTITIKGKGFNSLTQVSLGDSVQVKEIENLDDDTLSVKVLVPKDVGSGFQDVTTTDLLDGKSASLINGIYLGPKFNTDDTGDSTTKGGNKDSATTSSNDSTESTNNDMINNNKNSIGICADPNSSLMVSANILTSADQVSSLFDPILCNLTVGLSLEALGINLSNSNDSPSICFDKSKSLSISTTTLASGSTITPNFDPNACTLTIGIAANLGAATGVISTTDTNGDPSSASSIMTSSSTSSTGTVGITSSTGGAPSPSAAKPTGALGTTGSTSSTTGKTSSNGNKGDKGNKENNSGKK